jgi:phosphoribosylaminoimidazolecarboxamide formyltransferase/IMP cyclohydrolase
MSKVRRALVSVHDTSGLAAFVERLQQLGIEVVASQENAKVLADAGCSVATIAQHVGSEALVGAGGMQAIHPTLTQAIMTGGDSESGFDMVVANMLPFERLASRRESREHEVVAAIELERPAILRGAAANFEHVLVIADPEAYPLVIEELEGTDCDPSYEVRKLLASRAFDTTAHYELAIANWFSEVEDFPTYLLRDYVKLADLAYGENPHQRAAYYVEVGARRHLLSMVDQLAGDDVTFNNLADLNTARGLTADFSIPSCVIVKHGAPIGAAVSGDAVGAFERALSCDEASANGGVIAMNRTVDAATARAIGTRKFDVVFAPGFEDDAVALLTEHSPSLAVLLDNERRTKSPGERDMKRVLGGMLVQDTDSDLEDREFMDVVTRVSPTEAQWGDLLFAWRVSKWVRSNAIVLAQDLTTVGIGGGNPSRADGMVFALGKAGDRARGAMMASDAFLSYEDTVQIAIDAGIAGIIQPGGSDRDEDIIRMADAAGIPMVFTHRRHYRR